MTSPRRGKASHLTAYLAALIIAAIRILGTTESSTMNAIAATARTTMTMDGGDMAIGY